MDLGLGFGVLGSVTAWDADGNAIALKGPRHRSVLARLIVARGRVVPVSLLADDLWTDPPADAVGALRTFVAALRRALEPDRPPRTPARLLVTDGPGYALRAGTNAVDAWRFEQTVADAVTWPPTEATVRLDEALGWWRGPAYAEFADQPWARAESRRLAELRLHAVELRAEALLTLGSADRAAADLRAHAAEHPWRENAWRLLALALYRTGRQADALEVLRRARGLLSEQLGIDPGPGLRALETDILRQAAHLDRSDGLRQAEHLVQSGRLRRDAHLDQAEGLRRGEYLGEGERLRPGDSLNQAWHRDQGDSLRRAEYPEQGDNRRQAEDPGEGDHRRQAGHLSRSDDRRQERLGKGEHGRQVEHPGQGDHPRQAAGLPQADPDAHASTAATRVWEQVAAAYDRAVAPGARARLESSAGLLRGLAVTGGGGLLAAREHRVAAIAAAEELGDAELTARVIGAYDVPAIWTRLDDPDQAEHVVAAAERTLVALSAEGHEAAKARLLATIALESRGTPHARGPQAARQAEEMARRLDDPALLAFTLNAAFMQCFDSTGLASRRDGIGAELLALATRHGLTTFEILGHLIRLQARSALGDFNAADRHAAAADALAVRHETPLVGVFTGWYAALRLDATGRAPVTEVAAAYREAATLLHGAGMPGLAQGLLPLALLCLRVRHAQPLRFDDHTDWGPYAPWAHPLLLIDRGHRPEAAEALHATPEPPHDLLQEALWCLTARAALSLGDRPTLARAHTALTPAANELAGAGSGLLTLGPVSAFLQDITAALGRTAVTN
ncbi:BTAD domain-containing putative transcriptional regulator [Streptomyces sp. Marseille-Q5077]|uniref:AfsR/SARP family transcriptional regulator n=1 Tax=Streptomyces sp. Marseille-Q5077 TaxID=3418995 RepID=UPI003D01C40E